MPIGNLTYAYLFLALYRRCNLEIHYLNMTGVGEAKRILTDDTSRRRYDQTGSTSDRPTSSQYYQSQGFGGGPGYAGTPEDFFNAFFAGHNTYSRRSGRPSGFSFFEDGSSFFEQPNGARFQQHNGFYRRTQPQPSAASAFAPFLGLIAIFLFVVLLNYIGRSGSTTSDPFTLWKTDEHNTPHFTSDGLPYWLSPGYYSSSTLLSEKHRKAMDNDVYNAWYRFRDRECAQDRSQTRRNFAQPAEPRSCHLFEELKSLKNRREW